MLIVTKHWKVIYQQFCDEIPSFDPWHVLYTYLVPQKHTERPRLPILMVSYHLLVIFWQFGDEIASFDLQMRNFDRTLKFFHNVFQIGVRWLM